MGSVSTKRELRREVRERRAAMTPTQRAAASRALTERLIAVVRDHGARSISCFLSTPDEPDTSGLIEWAVEQGVEVLLPVSTRRDGEPHLAWARWTDAGAEPGAHGLLEPLGERLAETAVGEVDLMLIPACAVDRRGMRLGWGLGYYDRCLAALDSAPPDASTLNRRRPPIYAVVFDGDVLPEVPTDPHDAPIDGYITPSGITQ